MLNKILLGSLIAFCISGFSNFRPPVGETEITKWKDGKRGAISLTYDDGSVNQFRKALPIMNNLNLPGTFFILTGAIPGSQYQGKFIGRPVKTIIKETETIPTNKSNFFERASAVGYLGYEGTIQYHSNAGALFEAGKIDEAYKMIDDVYSKVRKGEFKAGSKPTNEVLEAKGISWDDIRGFAKQGHEFASHTITHPRLAVLDEANMLYEMEKSKEDIQKQLGKDYTFSFEGPYGTEDERVMEYAHKIYPALRNRMPENYLEELNRASKISPGSSEKEYVQWQRGATTKTPLPLMKTWVDTTATQDNIWLVLVFHGVDNIGWEALSSELLKEYFQYMKSNEDKLWVGTFGDVTKYMRERKNARVEAKEENNKIQVTLTHNLDKQFYNYPLTLKTYVSPEWKKVTVSQGDKAQNVSSSSDEKGTFILYQAVPNSKPIILSNS